MKKTIFYIAFAISLAVNIWLIVGELNWRKQKELSEIFSKSFGGSALDTTGWKTGFAMIKDSIRRKFPELRNKKYIFLGTWAPFCAPCIREMPWLDSLAGNASKDIAYIFISGVSDSAEYKIIQSRKYHIKHFRYLNNSDPIISAICKAQNKKSISFPMTVICDSAGKVLHKSIGAAVNFAEATQLFAEELKKLD